MPTSSSRMSPNQREALSAVSTVTHKQEYLSSTGGILNVNATVSIGGVAIPITGQTTALAVGIVDGSGNQITSFGGGTQYTDGGTPPTHPIAPTLEWSDGTNWQTVSTAKPLPVTVISGGGGGTQYTNGSLQATPTGTVALGWDTANVRALLTTNTGALILGAGAATIGSIANTSFAATQATAASLNATVVGTGTFAVQAAQTGTWNITNISGTVSLPTGASTAANQATEISSLATIATNTGAATPAGTNLIGKVGIDQTTLGTTNNVSTSVSSGAGTSNLVKDDTQFGDGVSSGIASEAVRLYNGSTYDRWRSVGTGVALVQENRTATTAVTSVAGSGTTVSLLASNANRRQATFYNDSSAILYLKLGTTASTTSYTVQMVASSYYELPQPIYTGEIDGIWASATGNARITELS